MILGLDESKAIAYTISRGSLEASTHWDHTCSSPVPPRSRFEAEMAGPFTSMPVYPCAKCTTCTPCSEEDEDPLQLRFNPLLNRPMTSCLLLEILPNLAPRRLHRSRIFHGTRHSHLLVKVPMNSVLHELPQHSP